MDVRLPDFLQEYRDQALALLKRDAVKEIAFSGSTYQVHIQDKKDGVDLWSFLQLDIHGALIDRFCGCEESIDTSSCAHLAAAYLRIYDNPPLPIHERFETSLWNQLCRLYAEKIGYEGHLLQKKGKGHYRFLSQSGKIIFQITTTKGALQLELEEVVEKRRRETEETSLKFSNLSETEISLWRQGRPSERLLYELSFWSDIAKLLFFLQDRQSTYKITFDYTSEGIPNRLTGVFKGLIVEFYLAQANLAQLIPALAGVKSPLPVHGFQGSSIQRMAYDPVTGVLRLEHKSKNSGQKDVIQESAEVIFGDWRYIPYQGFYPKEDHVLLSGQTVSGEQLGQLLSSYLPVLQQYLEGCTLHQKPQSLNYHLRFDSQWNLHIEAYLFHVGDLSLAQSRDFGDWVYLEGDGFYRLADRPFAVLNQVIKASEVADFVTEQRIWLLGQPGFSPHLTGLEADFSYSVRADYALAFHSYAAIDEEPGRHKDFGAWIYLADQGFFAKIGRSGSPQSPLRPGAVIAEASVPLFIRMVHEELQQITGFFRSQNPILSAGLHVTLTPSKGILIAPAYEIDPQVREEDLHFYGEYVYVKKEGFFELPSGCRPPDGYATPVVIPPKEVVAFVGDELERLMPRVSHLDPRLRRAQPLRLVLQRFDRLQQHGYEWYRLQMVFQSTGAEVSVTEVWQALMRKERYLFSVAGMLDLTDREFDWLRALKTDRVDVAESTVTLSILEVIRLHALNDLQPTSGKSVDDEECRQQFKKILALEERSAPDLTGLSSALRSYQLTGVHWVWSLYQHRLSSLLCDDMGLGKTHQAMGLMVAICNQPGEPVQPRRILVICPTSVIYHWQEKLAAFLPSLRVFTYYGAKRALSDFHPDDKILLTTYGLWRRDCDALKHLTFDLAIFDEIQMAKTHTSRLHAALLEVKSTMRLGLTGTPIENRLREIKALFDIVLPSYMPSEREYRDFFLRPIEKDNDPQRKALLRKLLHPFVLRRRKEDVLQDLPEKTEEIVHCQLSVQQVKLYREVLSLSRPAIMRQMADKDEPLPYLHVFALLSRLKQICNHPAAYLKKVQDYKQYASGKWDLFVELLGEARASGQKVVVFTQYLAMLDIFESFLTDHQIIHATIRGATTDRGEQMRRFNTDPTCEVFLGSIQASGLGVDLTAGSVVIHYDRWWNAARENQATDRVHRIGQTRGVQVFKLVTKGTFEERIDQLISSKGQLMEETIGVDDQEALKRFNRDELIQLLQDVETVISDETDDS